MSSTLMLQVISQLSENGAISTATRDEIETLLINNCNENSNFPRLAECRDETCCINAITSALGRIPELNDSDNSTMSLRQVRVCVCARACVRARVCVCVCACVRVRVCVQQLKVLLFREECPDLFYRGWLNVGLLGFAVSFIFNKYNAYVYCIPS